MCDYQLPGLLLTICLATSPAAGQSQVRYYDQGGVTYRETRYTIERPVYETRLQETTQTVYREQQTSELCPMARTCWRPITEYRYETSLAGRWNPLVEPYLVTQLVPRTRWELRTEVIQVPVTRRRLVPETRAVRTPVTVRRMVPQEVISRVAVSGISTPLHAVAPQGLSPVMREQIGGLARLDDDPPRYGVHAPWQSPIQAR